MNTHVHVHVLYQVNVYMYYTSTWTHIKYMYMYMLYMYYNTFIRKLRSASCVFKQILIKRVGGNTHDFILMSI